jgi:hypothetical protein
VWKKLTIFNVKADLYSNHCDLKGRSFLFCLISKEPNFNPHSENMLWSYWCLFAFKFCSLLSSTHCINIHFVLILFNSSIIFNLLISKMINYILPTKMSPFFISSLSNACSVMAYILYISEY